MTGSEKGVLVSPQLPRAIASGVDISNVCGREVGGRTEGRKGGRTDGKEGGTKSIILSWTTQS